MKIKQLAMVLLAMIASGLGAAPVFQPVVKEYCPIPGAAEFAVKTLPVFHQDQRQCQIAALETFVGGEKKAWNGSVITAKGVYIAIADSAAGRRLSADFTLDVPARDQGYAIRAEDGRVAIVGHDPIGALYGAVTFAQMSRSGTVEPAVVRDWPDVPYRTFISLGRGLLKFGHGETDEASRLAAIKEGIDLMLRFKINLYGDLDGIREGATSEKDYAFYRELVRYASERGIWCNYYATTAVYLRQTAPKGMKYDDWPCVKGHSPWQDSYYCWADDELTEAAARRTADHLCRLGADKCVINIHPVDDGSWQDPETWSRRCAKCRARWNDHERWKASVRQFNIWTRVLRARLPEAVIGSCAYPYQFNWLRLPEDKRTPQWRESVTEYWKNLDRELADKDFYFSSWITTPEVVGEMRRLVPSRPFHFSDTYPVTAGIFTTCHRKIGTACESGLDFVTTQGTDIYLRLESLILANEFLWDLHAPDAEDYDGATYYAGPIDHTGPVGVMTNGLRRICRTLWGDDLAPYLERVLASGVMPGYLQDPAARMSYWNKVRKDPNYDPMHPEFSRGTGNAKYPPLADTPERMLEQVRAAEACVTALTEAERHLQGLDRCRRKYFMGYAKYAPYWLATARARHVVRVANARLSSGDNAGALKTIEAERPGVLSGFDAAEATFARLAGESDTATNPRFPTNASKNWSFVRADAMRMLERAEASAHVVLAPRKIGRFVKVGIHAGSTAPCVKEYLDRFENVRAEIFDSLALAELNRFDCVFLTQRRYDKDDYFNNLKAYVEKGGGGVFFEGDLCGNRRFDAKTPFPEIVETSPRHVANFRRVMKFADGRPGETMYVDYFSLLPGPKGEILAYGPDGRDVLAVRGSAGLGKVVFLGTFNVGSLGDNYAVRQCPLFGANAEIARKAVEYFTGVRLVPRANQSR